MPSIMGTWDTTAVIAGSAAATASTCPPLSEVPHGDSLRVDLSQGPNVADRGQVVLALRVDVDDLPRFPFTGAESR